MPPPPDPHPAVAAWPWRFNTYHAGLSPVLPAVEAFCSAALRRENPPRWLSLVGPSGVGKTFVLKQAFACLSQNLRIKTKTGWRGPQCAHIVPSLDLQDFAAPRAYADYDLIYIEDIGSGADMQAGAGRVTRSRVIELLHLRSGRWTMLCANFYRASIAEHFDPRIASRLKRDGSWLVEIPSDVPDFWG